jgi:hypothetical protein
MSLRDDLLSTVSDVRTLPESLGLRRVRVALRAQLSTAALNTGGVVVEEDAAINPRPRVAVPREQPGWSGGAIGPAYDGRAARRRYTIGPLTREHAAGGLRVMDLFPVSSTPQTRPLVVLSDDGDDGELGRDPIAFRVESVRLTQFSLYLDVIEADSVT